MSRVIRQLPTSAGPQRPSLLPIERFSEHLGSASGSRQRHLIAENLCKLDRLDEVTSTPNDTGSTANIIASTSQTADVLSSTANVIASTGQTVIASTCEPANVISQTSETPSIVAHGRQAANVSEAIGFAVDDDKDPFSQIDSGLKIDLIGYKSAAARTDRLLDAEEQRTRDISQTSLAMSKAFDKVEKLAASFALCLPRLLECLEAIASHYQLRSVSLSNRPTAILLDVARRQDASLATLAAFFWARVTSAAVLSVADCETAGLVLKDCPQCKANSQEDIGAYLVVLKRREAQGTVEYGYSGATTQAFSKRWKAHTDGSSTSSTKRLASEDTEALIMLAITSTGVRRSLRTLFLVRLWESIVGVAWPLRRAMAVRTVAQLDELLVMCYFSTRQGGFEGVSRGNVDFEPLNQHIPGAIGQVEAGYLGDLSDDDSEVDEEADHDVHITETDDDVADLERASLGTLHFSLGERRQLCRDVTYNGIPCTISNTSTISIDIGGHHEALVVVSGSQHFKNSIFPPPGSARLCVSSQDDLNFQPAGAHPLVSLFCSQVEISIVSSSSSTRHVLAFTATIVPRDWSYVVLTLAGLLGYDQLPILPETTGAYATDAFIYRLLEPQGARLRLRIDGDGGDAHRDDAANAALIIPMDLPNVAFFGQQERCDVTDRHRTFFLPHSMVQHRLTQTDDIVLSVSGDGKQWTIGYVWVGRQQLRAIAEGDWRALKEDLDAARLYRVLKNLVQYTVARVDPPLATDPLATSSSRGPASIHGSLYQPACDDSSRGSQMGSETGRRPSSSQSRASRRMAAPPSRPMDRAAISDWRDGTTTEFPPFQPPWSDEASVGWPARAPTPKSPDAAQQGEEGDRGSRGLRCAKRTYKEILETYDGLSSQIGDWQTTAGASQASTVLRKRKRQEERRMEERVRVEEAERLQEEEAGSDWRPHNRRRASDSRNTS